MMGVEEAPVSLQIGSLVFLLNRATLRVLISDLRIGDVGATQRVVAMMQLANTEPARDADLAQGVMSAHPRSLHAMLERMLIVLDAGPT